jgi:hypothetical protein
VAVIIELGEIAPGDLDAGWRPRVQTRQRLLVLAAAGLLLAWMAGSVPRTPQLGAPLWSTRTSASGFIWGSDVAYALDPDGQAVAALDPVTGARRWRTVLDAPGLQLAEVQPGVLAVQLGPRAEAGPTDQQLGDLAVLLLGGGGRVIARVPGQLWTILPGGTLLLLQPVPGCQTGDCTQLARIDPATGRVAWSLPTEEHGYLPLQSCQDTTFGVAVGDTVQIRSMANAEVISELRALDTDNGLLQTGVLYGDELVVAELVHNALLVTGYPLAPTVRPWSVTLPQGTTPNGVSAGLLFTSCGSLLSAQLADSTAIIDRRTGVVRAQVPGDLFVVPDIGAASPDSDGHGILLALSGPSATAARNVVLVLDADHGTRVATYRDNAILPWDAAHGRAMLMHWDEATTAFTALDERGRPSALGRVDGTDLTCRARAVRLACWAADGVVRVWRVPRYALP